MTGDVLAHGADRPPSRRGLAVGVAALVALAGIALATRDGSPDARPAPAPTASPTASPATTAPAGPRPSLGPDVPAVTARRPASRGVGSLLLAGDVPGFIAAIDPNVVVVAASGGPEHAPVLVGWCPASRIFQDADGRYRYGMDGTPYDAVPGLLTYRTVANAVDPALVDVSASGARGPNPGTGGGPPACAAGELVWPPLPGRATRVEQTLKAARQIHGRYVVTIETRAFCPGPPTTGRHCQAAGWEVHGNALPPDDLATEYVWEGEFLVRANASNGSFVAIRLPGTRLVTRAGVGVESLRGYARSARAVAGERRLEVVTSGPDREPTSYVVRPDVAVFLGPGRTGLGKPPGTWETLRAWVADERVGDHELWLLLDGRGRVVRAVAARR